MLKTSLYNTQICKYSYFLHGSGTLIWSSLCSRTICTLFLGWTFWLAIQYTFIHVWIDIIPNSLRESSRSLWRRASVEGDIEEKANHSPTSNHSDASSIAGHTCKILLLLLNVCVAAAAIGTFVSLLAFNESNAAGSCGEHHDTVAIILSWADNSSFTQL